jgi:hypothetical protein
VLHNEPVHDPDHLIALDASSRVDSQTRSSVLVDDGESAKAPTIEQSIRNKSKRPTVISLSHLWAG